MEFQTTKTQKTKIEKINLNLTMKKENYLELYKESQKIGVSVQNLINLKLFKTQ
jgi:hypothetical protein